MIHLLFFYSYILAPAANSPFLSVSTVHSGVEKSVVESTATIDRDSFRKRNAVSNSVVPKQRRAL